MTMLTMSTILLVTLTMVSVAAAAAVGGAGTKPAHERHAARTSRAGGAALCDKLRETSSNLGQPPTTKEGSPEKNEIPSPPSQN